MAELVRYTYRLPDDTERRVVAVDDDGTVHSDDLHPPAGPAPEVGWWEGRLADDVLGPLLQLITATIPEVGALPPPSAAGTWWVAWPSGEMPLAFGVDDAEAHDALVSQFSAMLSVCEGAATTPVLVLRFEATMPDPGSGHPLLTVTAPGASVEVVVDKTDPGDDASFVTADLDTLGYFGSGITVPSGGRAHALLSRVVGRGDELSLGGTITAPDGTPASFEVVVEVPAE